MKKWNWKKGGFSLVQVMIAMGAMGMLSVFMLRMMSNQQKQQKTVEANIEINHFLQILRSELAHPEACLKNFYGLKVSEAEALNIEYLKDRTGKIRYQRDALYGNHRFRIMDITLGPFEKFPTQLGKGRLSLNLNLEKSGKVYGNKQVLRKLPLTVSLSSSGQIATCIETSGEASSAKGKNSFVIVEKNSSDTQEENEKTLPLEKKLLEMGPEKIQEAILKGKGPEAEAIHKVIEGKPSSQGPQKFSL